MRTQSLRNVLQLDVRRLQGTKGINEKGFIIFSCFFWSTMLKVFIGEKWERDREGNVKAVSIY